MDPLKTKNVLIVATAVAIVALALVFGITFYNVNESNSQQQVATTCVKSGGQWRLSPAQVFECIR